MTTEDIRREHADLTARSLAANRELEGTLEQIASLKTEIVAAGARYEEECLALADGSKTADPTAASATQVALQHKLRVLEQLRDRQAADIQPMGERMLELNRLLDQKLFEQEEETLLAGHENLARALKEAEAKFHEARLAFHASLLAVGKFRTRKENRASDAAWQLRRAS